VYRWFRFWGLDFYFQVVVPFPAPPRTSLALTILPNTPLDSVVRLCVGCSFPIFSRFRFPNLGMIVFPSPVVRQFPFVLLFLLPSGATTRFFQVYFNVPSHSLWLFLSSSCPCPLVTDRLAVSPLDKPLIQSLPLNRCQYLFFIIKLFFLDSPTILSHLLFPCFFDDWSCYGFNLSVPPFEKVSTSSRPNLAGREERDTSFFGSPCSPQRTPHFPSLSTMLELSADVILESTPLAPPTPNPPPNPTPHRNS